MSAAVLCATIAAPMAVAAPRPAPCAGRCWHPAPVSRAWQIQLSGRADLRVTAPVFELDCDETAAGSVRTLHRHGVHVLGYLDAGSWESYRSDAPMFPADVIGKAYDGYPDERWLDIRRRDVLMPLISRRLRTCARKGFDGVDPDNVNGYENDTGFPLTATDQLRFDRAVADTAHGMGLAVVLKNTGGLAGRLGAWFDGAVVESCLAYDECGRYRRFADAGKPVFAIEYTPASRRACRRAHRFGLNLIFKRPALDASRGVCAAG